jgi:hypothetical protein
VAAGSENTFDRAKAEAVVETLGAHVRLERLERQHLGSLLLHVLRGGADQLGPEAAAARCRTHVEQVEEPCAITLAVECGDPDVIREEDEIVFGT